jgi:hypothetical protein
MTLILGEKYSLDLPEIRDEDGDPFYMKIDNFTNSGLYRFTDYSEKFISFTPSDP